MASIPQCVFCFETLDAALSNRKPLSLAQTEKLWDQYVALNSDDPMEQDEDESSSEARETEDEDGEASMGGAAAAEEDEPDRQITSPRKTRRANSPPPPSSKPSSSLLSVPNLLAGRQNRGSSGHSSHSSSTSPSTRSTSSTQQISQRSSQTSLSVSQPDSASSRPPCNQNLPLFVTWSTISRNSGRKSLRGCIGTFEPQELQHGLAAYALTSALEDSRFPPVEPHELPHLQVGITLLTDFEPAPGPLTWDIGVHGIRISFTHQGKRLGATYLPDVAREQGWSKTETMVSLMRKAGWSGRREEWTKVADMSVVRYQGRKCTAEYEVWRGWREWVEEGQVDL